MLRVRECAEICVNIHAEWTRTFRAKNRVLTILERAMYSRGRDHRDWDKDDAKQVLDADIYNLLVKGGIL